jgi:hypothetical protein
MAAVAVKDGRIDDVDLVCNFLSGASFRYVGVLAAVCPCARQGQIRGYADLT